MNPRIKLEDLIFRHYARSALLSILMIELLLLPGMNGYDTTREIRKIRDDLRLSQVPIIAMTANAMAHDRDLCLQAGMDDYIPKPFSPETLASQLRRWVEDR